MVVCMPCQPKNLCESSKFESNGIYVGISTMKHSTNSSSVEILTSASWRTTTTVSYNSLSSFLLFAPLCCWRRTQMLSSADCRIFACLELWRFKWGSRWYDVGQQLPSLCPILSHMTIRKWTSLVRSGKDSLDTFSDWLLPHHVISTHHDTCIEQHLLWIQMMYHVGVESWQHERMYIGVNWSALIVVEMQPLLEERH